MTREEIIEKLKAMEPELRARGITRMQMFGSRARGDNREDSDLDLLIEVDPKLKISLIELAGIHLDLSEAFGIEANLFEPHGLGHRMAKRIEGDLIPVFA